MPRSKSKLLFPSDIFRKPAQFIEQNLLLRCIVTHYSSLLFKLDFISRRYDFSLSRYSHLKRDVIPNTLYYLLLAPTVEPLTRTTPY